MPVYYRTDGPFFKSASEVLRDFAFCYRKILQTRQQRPENISPAAQFCDESYSALEYFLGFEQGRIRVKEQASHRHDVGIRQAADSGNVLEVRRD